MTTSNHCPTCGREYTRSSEQNAMLHAILHDIAAQKDWAGERRDVETWKRLMVCAWMRATGRSAEMLPALDGHGFDVLYHRTSRLGKSEMSELIEYVQAWAVDNNITLREAA